MAPRVRTPMIRCLSMMVISLVLLAACATTPPAPPAATKPASGAKASPSARGIGIVLFGRSVTEGWFRHWGVQPGRGFVQGPFRLLHRTFDDGPNETRWPEQVVSALRRFGPHLQAVQVKLCFVDFTEETDLAPYQRTIEAIYRAVVERGKKKLLIGNALPNVAGASPAGLIAKQRAFNGWLGAFAKKHPQVHIFEQYEVLSTEKGVLDPRYASSPSDAHLNELGYAALDTGYFAFLRQVFPQASKVTP